MSKVLKVTELFTSIQGEGRHQGLLCYFIRLTGCNLRCSYCDTKYAYESGELFEIEQLVRLWRESGVGLVQITGGEPLMQDDSIILMEQLINKGAKILLETNGSVSLKRVPLPVVKVVDIKTPGSGMAGSFLWENLRYINGKDEIKFVVTGIDDFLWAIEVIKNYQLDKWTNVLISPVYEFSKKDELAKMHIMNRINARFQVQLHKILWGEKSEIFITKNC